MYCCSPHGVQEQHVVLLPFCVAGNSRESACTWKVLGLLRLGFGCRVAVLNALLRR